MTNKLPPLSLAAASSTSPDVHRERVVAFLREWTGEEVSKKLRCQFFALLHVGGEQGENRDPVHQVEIPFGLEEAARLERCEQAATKLVDAAVGHASFMSGRAQKFMVGSYTSTDAEKAPTCLLPFSVAPTSAVSGSGMQESEMASPAGALGQSMRWSESFARMLVMSLDRAQERGERLTDRLLERLDASENRNITLTEQREVLLDRAQERSLNLYKGKLGIEREERLYRAIEVLGTQWVSQKIGAPVDNPMVGFLKSLDMAQLQAMAATLPPEKQQELVEVVRSLNAVSGAEARQPPRMNVVTPPQKNGAS